MREHVQSSANEFLSNMHRKIGKYESGISYDSLKFDIKCNFIRLQFSEFYSVQKYYFYALKMEKKSPLLNPL